MGQAQRHRGPDGTALTTSCCGRAVLAMNTLRIVDPKAAIGPYTDEATGIVLAFNGQIYNWRRLAADWGITLGRGETDAHALLRAWAKLGPGCLDALDGMFAFAVFDPRDGRLTLVRDRLGEKPLYWRLDGPRVAFASEVSALLGYGPTAVVARAEMASVETPLGADTPFQGVQLLEPGCLLVVHTVTGSLSHHRWWDLAEVPVRDLLAYGDALPRFAVALAERVPERAPAGDFALLLSGGIDSTMLAYLMRPQVCVTVRYPGRDRLDESQVAAEIAKDVGAELIVVEPRPEEFPAALGHMMAALDYPMGNAAVFSEYQACQTVAKLGIRVVVGGLGPDELLMGYARHALALFGAGAVMRTPALHSYRPLAAKLGADAATGCTDAADAAARLMVRGPDPDGRIGVLVADCFARAGGDPARGLTLAELETAWRPLVLTSDKLAAAFSMERRSPYLARDLVELAWSLPVGHKIAEPGVGKRILRDAARTLGLPRAVWDNRDKLGFASPLPDWLGSELRDWADRTISSALPKAPEAFRPLLRAGLAAGGRFDRTRTLAVMTASWLSPEPVSQAA
ncbi:asparagine synthetase B family protein [Yinghuangia sp. YIM S09857]|uniref:asparagine synthetase B family protein n=1 Tax=Yinghuangia sp. YIM S09857 TaxID=3436929 RepID=UPI003F52CC85